MERWGCYAVSPGDLRSQRAAIRLSRDSSGYTAGRRWTLARDRDSVWASVFASSYRGHRAKSLILGGDGDGRCWQVLRLDVVAGLSAARSKHCARHWEVYLPH